MTKDTKDNKDKYKDSVFLPKTDFPMRGGLPTKEPEILQKWQEMDLYSKMRESARGKEKWILHDGPPYANGNIHMGHAVNKILKDVVVKSYGMMGYDTPYVPGWDCHGLPIEWKIEEKYREAGKDKDEVDILQFRDECRKFAGEWVDIQSEQFQRLGVSGDWQNPYRTMTNRAEAGIVREIHKFVSNGGLYKGAKPVLWSVVEKTALAEAEVEYKEHKSVTVWVRFPVVKAAHPALEGADIVIWTTTPWTIPSNRALAYGAEMEYGVYEVKEVGEGARCSVGDRLVLSTTLSASIMENAKVEEAECLATLKGSDLAGTICHHPLHGTLHPSSRTSEAEGERDPGSMEGKPDSQWIPASAGMTPEEGEAIYDFDVPLLAGDFVTDEAGTGFVHIAPGHGEDDFNLVMRHNNEAGLQRGQDRYGSGIVGEPLAYPHDIEITDNVADDGTFRPHVPLFAGLEVYTQKGEMGAGNFAVLKALDESGNLLAKGSMRHEYPHSWRSKAPLIFRTTPQWFIGMDRPISSLHGSSVQSMDHTHEACDDGRGTMRSAALKAIKDTQWVPAKGEARINAMIANRPDWCISRQRAWGVPIALFMHKDTGEVLKDEAVLKRIGDIFEEEGSDAWWARAPQDFLGNDYKAEDYDQVFDIVDVWFESGSTHQFVVKDTKTWPDYEGVGKIDLYLEGSDQHRGWFHSSLLESVGTTGEAPYKSVLTHGFVLDEKGYKMSKSLGNVIDPLKMMEQYGADILRLWTMSSNYAEDIRIGQDMLKSTGDLYRRIRNTLRFLLGALDGFTLDERVDLASDEVPELERLMLHQLSITDTKVREHIEKYEFQKLAKLLHDFCNEELSAFYFDIRKDCLYCDDPASFKRRACRSVMAKVFEHLTAWLAPILCFTAEEAWSHRPEGVFEDTESVHLREFVSVPAEWRNYDLAADWDVVKLYRKTVLEAIEPLRASKELGSSLEAAPVIAVPAEQKSILDKVDMAEVCITSSAVIQDGASVKIQKASGSKCQRCWKVLPEVDDNDGVCDRCAAVLDV